MKRKIGSEPNSGAGFHPQAENMIDFFVQCVGRQTVIRNTRPEHTTQFIKYFKNFDLETFQP